MTNEQIGMILSLLGMAINVLSFQVKYKAPLMIMQTVGSTLFMLSYFFSGGGMGFVLNILMLIRNFVFMFYKPRKKMHINVTCIILCVSYVITYVIYTALAGETLMNNVWNVFPIIAAFFGTVSFANSNVNLLRAWKYGDSVCWLTYNLHIGIGALGGIVGEILNLISLTVGILRFRERRSAK